jgi:hypothetical protein
MASVERGVCVGKGIFCVLPPRSAPQPQGVESEKAMPHQRGKIKRGTNQASLAETPRVSRLQQQHIIDRARLSDLIFPLFFSPLFSHHLSLSFLQVLAQDIDLLHPPAALEQRKHKLKRLVQSPNSFFMDVKCQGCFNITTVFSHSQTVVRPGSLWCF